MSIITRIKNFIGHKPKIIVVLGQTSTGKSDLAVRLANYYNGEVISADSRQVYRGIDLASGKITQSEMQGIPHHMIDITEPRKRYTVADYVREAEICITDILERHKTPIICGGTGFYIDALLSGQEFDETIIESETIADIEEKTNEEIFQEIKTKDPKRAKTIDPHNRVRLIRSLALINTLGYMPDIKQRKRYHPLFIGLKLPKSELDTRIWNRIISRIEQGMINEVQTLGENGISDERLDELGLECRYITQYLNNTLNLESMIDELYRATVRFSKRQYTWFKRNKDIHWFNPIIDQDNIDRMVRNFLKK